MNKHVMAFFVMLIFTGVSTISAKAGWQQENDRWRYETDGSFAADRWITDNQQSYYLDENGYLKAGWLKLSDSWYFLNPVHDGTYGRALKGWNWIDGYCYYFQDDGKMLTDTISPDGYQLSASGAWSLNGKNQYISKKGILTVKTEEGIIRLVGGGSSAGGSSGGSSSGGGSSAGSSSGGGLMGGGSLGGGIMDGGFIDGGLVSGGSLVEDLNRPQRELSYTIQYLEKETESELSVRTGQGLKHQFISIPFIELDGYKICQGQTKGFVLHDDHFLIRIYYEKQKLSTPSNGEMVGWQVSFIEEGKPENEVFKRQEGLSPEGTELVIDFPEIILTKEYSYQAEKSSPYKTVLSGNGVQKFYIEFKKYEIPEEPDLENLSKERLKRWLEISRLGDEKLTGKTPVDENLITDSPESSNERLKNLISMTSDTGRHEIYLIGKNHIPDSFVLNHFTDIKNISELTADSFEIGEDSYTVVKIGYQVVFQTEVCSHKFSVNNMVKAGCLTPGTESISCEKCTFQESASIPPLGHQAGDEEGICRNCFQTISGNERAEPVHFEIGDIQARELGGRLYLFRCIDDDYEDSLNNRQKAALFLCEQVIRSDIDRTSEAITTLPFGVDNNYKTSSVRNWLKENFSNHLLGSQASYIGISKAYSGATGKGDWEQFDESVLIARDKPFQMMEDNMFLLSLEEAIKYREYLWRFEGSDTNNPQTQYSSFSRGYWLRTPKYEEKDGEFIYGTDVYLVDLEQGNIHTAMAKDRTIGMRPAITVLQN